MKPLLNILSNSSIKMFYISQFYWHFFLLLWEQLQLVTILWDTGACWHDCITYLLQVWQLRTHAANLPFCHIPLACDLSHAGSSYESMQQFIDTLCRSNDLYWAAQCSSRKDSLRHLTATISLNTRKKSGFWESDFCLKVRNCPVSVSVCPW